MVSTDIFKVYDNMGKYLTKIKIISTEVLTKEIIDFSTSIRNIVSKGNIIYISLND